MADASAVSATAPTANSAAAVTMLRCLSQCRDVQFALMQLLTLKDLAALNSTCRSWRRWLLHPPLIGGPLRLLSAVRFRHAALVC